MFPLCARHTQKKTPSETRRWVSVSACNTKHRKQRTLHTVVYSSVSFFESSTKIRSSIFFSSSWTFVITAASCVFGSLQFTSMRHRRTTQLCPFPPWCMPPWFIKPKWKGTNSHFLLIWWQISPHSFVFYISASKSASSLHQAPVPASNLGNWGVDGVACVCWT